jgi:hypothetical protein
MLSAREWKSADGSRSFEAEFIAAKDGQMTLRTADNRSAAYPLSAFSKTDQTFAKDAQAIAESAAKYGPRTFQITQIVEGGWLCRMADAEDAKKAQPLVFLGETFFCLAREPAKGSVGQVFDTRPLFAAGGRTLHPLKGAPVPIRAFALSVEEAATAWREIFDASGGDPAKQSPPVMEPEVQIVTTLGMGVAVGKAGLVLTDSALLRDATAAMVHVEGKDHPARILASDADLGVALLSCELPLEPVRMASKKPLEVGQSVFAVHLEFNTSKRDFLKSPLVTRGIVSRQGKTSFEHDASLPADSPGGFVVGDKGDVAGVFFRSHVKGGTRGAAASKSEPGPSLAETVKTPAIFAFLAKTAGAATARSPASDEIEPLGKALRDACVLIVATQEKRIPRAPPKAGPVAKTAGQPPPAGEASAGWSLSKSGVRHNSKCKFYNAATPCAATDGRPCKVCGG